MVIKEKQVKEKKKNSRRMKISMAAEVKQKELVIKCPHCGYEYHPAEIFTAISFTGKPVDIVRDCLGKIIYVEYEKGKELDLVEHYVCENCERAFQVEATISYKVKEEKEELDFTNQEVSLI